MVGGVLAPMADAVALWDDRLELFAAESITWDDNVFRLPSNVDPFEALGSPSKGDTYLTTSVGISFDVPVSAQRFVGDATLSRHRFERFGNLDLDGHEARAEWRWRIGDVLRGQLGRAQRQTLASFANVQSGAQSGTPNFRKVNNSFFEARHDLGTRWQVSAGFSRLDHSNSAEEYQPSDVSSDIVELKAAYVTPAESLLGFTIQVTDSHMPNRQLLAGIPVDNSFRQQTVAALVEWAVTPISRVSASAGPIRRSHAQLPERDFDGWMLRGAYEWKATDRLTLVAAAERDISSVEEVYVGFALIESLALSADYEVTEKVDLSMYLSSSHWDYLGEPGLALGMAPPRSERVRFGRLSLSYRPTRILTLEFTLRRDTRSSALDFANYEAGIASLGIRAAF